MKRSTTLLLAGVCATGLLAGLAARRLVSGAHASATSRVAVASQAAENIATGEISTDATPGTKQTPLRRSSETLETLLAIEDGTLYSRLALWLIDASEKEIAAYWQAYQKKDRSKRSRDIHDLVFLNWARLNPQGAIAGAGPGNEQYAWWAWACHDPKASLAAAVAVGGDRLNDVTFGLGEFHAEWLREHFREIPEEGRQKALAGLVKWDDGQNPLETLRFMKENGIAGASPGTIKALARQDPQAAIQWARENPAGPDYPMNLVLETMAAERPDDLALLAAQTPSGEAKLKMESALFANLLKSDPAAALEEARASTVPRTAAERYAAIGLGLVKSDPEQAFALAKDLFAACPQAANNLAIIEFPGSTHSDSNAIPGVKDFTAKLMAQDPARLLDMTTATPPDTLWGTSFGILSYRWIERDPAGYAEWVNRQTDDGLRQKGAGIVIDQLQEDGHYSEAVEWTMSLGNDPAPRLSSLLINWGRQDPQATSAWLDASNLPPTRKAAIKASIEQSR